MSSAFKLSPFILILFLSVQNSVAVGKSPIQRPILYPKAGLRSSKPFITKCSPHIPPSILIHGGNVNNEEEILKKKDSDGIENSNDEDRYSRQLYTLGARAHKLVRSTNVLLDGPFSSGLTYECGKNLALSGVGGVILIRDTDGSADEQKNPDTDDISQKNTADQNQRLRILHKVYHNDNLDDLGNSYRNAAHNEIAMENSGKSKLETHQQNGKTKYHEFLLLEYLKRLNPSLKISVINRSELEQFSNNFCHQVGDNPIFLSVDRPQSTQLLMNAICREQNIPFISVESRGVYGKVFCDFGNQFYVVDEDGETPKNTLFDNAKINATTQVMEIYCVEGEKHDVSKGDVITFTFDNDEDSNLEDNESTSFQFEVVYVNSPSQITVQLRENEATDNIEYMHNFMERAQQSSQPISFARMKIPRHVPFLSLTNALDSCFQKDQNLFAASDLDKSFDEGRRTALMTSFAALDKFATTNGRLPYTNKSENENDNGDIETFLTLAQSLYDSDQMSDDTKWKNIVQSFAKCACAYLTPVQALMGSLGAQEALKAASGLYNPIQQFLLFDCDELLVHSATQDDRIKSTNDPAPGQSHILGSHVTSALASQRIFVVGSGAIGCEILKNLSAMGVATTKKGCIFLTDMDTIERSNLSRQLLFRDADVGKFKSAAAKEAVLRINPNISILAHSSKVGEDATGTFDDIFWSKKIDLVLNALDNVEARLFIDKKCVENRKGLIDAGTLGSKGNMQVVIPMHSESYGSSVDPPEPAIPVCTLKNFPYEISHTIQWGRDLFDGLFNRRPIQASNYRESLLEMGPDDLGHSMLEKLGEDAAFTAAEEIAEDLEIHFSSRNFNDDEEDDEKWKVDVDSLKETCLKWAVKLAENLFQNSINALLRQHPKDSVDENGDPFWEGTRRCPKALSFTISSETLYDQGQTTVNQQLVEFIQSATRLRMQIYLPEKLHGSCIISATDAISSLKSILHDGINSQNEEKKEEEVLPILSKIVANLNKATLNLHNYPKNLKGIEFEKDDDSNDHVTFVNAASNLRAIIYSITPTSKMETRRIAGRIVPAMITTTAFVSALSCIEMMKLTLQFPMNLHRNAFVNLALPFFAFTQPLPADEYSGLNGESYTIWDRIVIKEREKHVMQSDDNVVDEDEKGVTMRQFLKLLKKKIGDGSEISTISYGPYMIYANFLHSDDTFVLDQSIWGLLRETIICGDEIDEVELDDELEADNGSSGFRNIPKNLTDAQLDSVRALKEKTFVEFSVVAEEEHTGEEVELPPVRLLKWRAKK